MDNPPLISGSPTLLWEGHGVAVLSPIGGQGALRLPANSGMIEEYVTVCDNIFRVAGELGQQDFTSMFSQEMSTGDAGLPLELVTDYGLALSYVKREHGPAELRRLVHWKAS